VVQVLFIRATNLFLFDFLMFLLIASIFSGKSLISGFSSSLFVGFYPLFLALFFMFFSLFSCLPDASGVPNLGIFRVSLVWRPKNVCLLGLGGIFFSPFVRMRLSPRCCFFMRDPLPYTGQVHESSAFLHFAEFRRTDCRLREWGVGVLGGSKEESLAGANPFSFPPPLPVTRAHTR